MSLSENAKKVFEKLYSLKNEKNIDETFERVAKDFVKDEEDFNTAFKLQKENKWRPNTPVYLNAGSNKKFFSACHVSGLLDSMDSIYDVLNISRKIFNAGAGIGIPIGNLREKEAFIFDGEPDKEPEGKSSGAVSFLKIYDVCGETTKSGGKTRRAAILCSMPVWHPDILDFIRCKDDGVSLQNMNLSVAITDKFMDHLETNTPFSLHTPYDGSTRGFINPDELWTALAESCYKTGDPGILFIDTINKTNILNSTILIETTNPCGEQPLPPYSNCALSAINVSKFEKDGEIDFENIYLTSYNVLKLMDNMIDNMDYIDPRFKTMSQRYRNVGIGPMGLADLFLKCNIKYDSAKGKKTAGEIMRELTAGSIERSTELAKEKGPFFEYEKHKENAEKITQQIISGHRYEERIMDKVKKYGLRNCAVTTCAPTGTTALSCDCSYGIEPLFGLVFQKNLIDGSKMIVSNPIFEEKYKEEEWFNETTLNKIYKNGGSLKGLHGIPKEVKELCVTAHDIKWKDRIDIQASLQTYCSSGISSTVNLKEDSTVEEIKEIYSYSYKKGLKGITIYRDGSKKNQPITFKEKDKIKKDFKRPSLLSGQIFKLDTGNGKMYVTISTLNGKPIEVFIHIGKSGQVINTFSEALGRVVSIALQNNVPIEDIIKTLIGINSDKPTWARLDEEDKKMSQILSVPDGLAQLLRRFYLKSNIEEEFSDGDICPDCGISNLISIEGCSTCNNCGYSKCS